MSHTDWKQLETLLSLEKGVITQELRRKLRFQSSQSNCTHRVIKPFPVSQPTGNDTRGIIFSCGSRWPNPTGCECVGTQKRGHFRTRKIRGITHNRTKRSHALFHDNTSLKSRALHFPCKGFLMLLLCILVSLLGTCTSMVSSGIVYEGWFGDHF